MSGFRGVNKLRRTLRRIEPEGTKHLKKMTEDAAELIRFDAIMNAKGAGLYDTGEMILSIDVKMGRDNLTAVIGPGAKHVRITKNPFDTTQYKSKPSKHSAMQFFKAYWAEFGTKGDPTRNIPPQPATPFMNPAFDANKQWIAKKTQEGIRAALRYASDG